MFVYVWYPNRYDRASLFLPATSPISPFHPASLSLPVNPLFPSRSLPNHPSLSFFSQIINVKPLQTEDPSLGIYLGLVKHYWLTLTHISNCPVGRQITQEVGEGSVVSYHLNGVWSALVLSCWFPPSALLIQLKNMGWDQRSCHRSKCSISAWSRWNFRGQPRD